jgi:hypothetical protein
MLNIFKNLNLHFINDQKIKQSNQNALVKKRVTHRNYRFQHKGFLARGKRKNLIRSKYQAIFIF